MYIRYPTLGLASALVAGLVGCSANGTGDTSHDDPFTDSVASALEDTATDDDTGSGEEVLVYDDFRGGFTTEGPGAKWDPPIFADGITSTSSRGLRVIPSGTNPVTGQPAFASTTGQQSSGGYGTMDHIKWAGLLRHTSTAGFSGWDTPASGVLSCTTTISSVGTGLDAHPFGSNVSDAQSDLRLGASVMLFTDQETNSVFDFFVTNKQIYAIYERLPRQGSTYAAFNYSVPVATRTSTAQQDNLTISVNQQSSSATWWVNGRSVLQVNGIGTRAVDRKYMTLDHGGTPQVVRPRQLDCGLGTFTLLDGALAPQSAGLVRLDSTVDYFAPRSGAPARQTFFDEHSDAQNRLWGQGVQLNVAKIKVTRSAK
ncbi:DUF6081 family protein [Pendulispora rubella]|uniref:DUF6081 family protein n=1 Tax=Pendulispora rubella TaxID=2741070 RepID=A0ABZ2L0B7_9BACT